MPSGAGNRHAVQHLKEVEVERPQQCVRSASLGRQLAPCVEGLLRPAEDLVDGFAGVQLRVDDGGVALVGELELVFKIVETVVDRRGGEHQHLRLDARAHDAVQQAEVAVLASLLAGQLAAVAEVMTLVNDHKVIVAPVDTGEVDAVGLAAVTAEVGMIQHIVAEPIRRDGVVVVVVLVGVPVL